MRDFLFEPSYVLRLTDRSIFEITFGMVKIQNASNKKLIFNSVSRNTLHAAESVNIFTMRARQGYFNSSKEDKYALKIHNPLISLLSIHCDLLH